MAWRIEFAPAADKELGKLGRAVAQGIICDIDDGVLVVLVLKASPRGDVYR